MRNLLASNLVAARIARAGLREFGSWNLNESSSRGVTDLTIFIFMKKKNPYLVLGTFILTSLIRIALPSYHILDTIRVQH